MKKTAKQTTVTATPVATPDPSDRLYLFLVWGKGLAPKRVTMNALRKDFFDERCRLAETRTRDPEQARARVYSEIFGKGAEFAVLCHKASMAQLATGYPKDAPHSQALKYLAACIALGRVANFDTGDQPDDGQEAPIDPVKPKPTKPSGGTRVEALATVGA